MCSSYVLQFLVQHPDPLRCYGKQGVVTFVFGSKPGISHGSPPAVAQIFYHIAVENIFSGHLRDGDVQQIIQTLEYSKAKCDLCELWIFFLYQLQYHVRIVDVVREHSGEPVFISGVKSNMVSLFSFSTITWILPFETSPSNLKVY